MHPPLGELFQQNSTIVYINFKKAVCRNTVLNQHCQINVGVLGRMETYGLECNWH